LLFNRAAVEDRRVFARFRPKPPLPVSAVAAKYGMDARRLAQAYVEHRELARAIVRFARGEADKEEVAAVRGRLSLPMIRALAELYALA